jgi:serine/threonine-protein kinase
LLTGESLSEIVRRGPLSLPLAVQILRQVAAAMNAAHDVGIIHRDLKPDNILVCGPPGREVVKVLDFGLAKVAGQSRLTKRGMVFGTPHYMSPEQASGELLDPRSDIYSYGVVAYECFTGTVPFEADTFMGVMTQHMYVDPVPPRQVLGVTEQLGALEEITLRCLEKKPSARYPSMRHVLEALDEALGVEAEGRITVKPAPERPSRVQPRTELASRPTVSVAAVRRSRQRWAWALGWGAAASVVIGTGLAVWSAARGADREGDRAPQQAPTPVPVSPAAPRIGERGAVVRKADTPKAAPRRVTSVGAGATTPEAAREGERLAPSMREAESRQAVAATGSSGQTGPRASASPPPRKSNDKTSQSVIGGEIVDPWLP